MAQFEVNCAKSHHRIISDGLLLLLLLLLVFYINIFFESKWIVLIEMTCF